MYAKINSFCESLLLIKPSDYCSRIFFDLVLKMTHSGGNHSYPFIIRHVYRFLIFY